MGLFYVPGAECAYVLKAVNGKMARFIAALSEPAPNGVRRVPRRAVPLDPTEVIKAYDDYEEWSRTNATEH